MDSRGQNSTKTPLDPRNLTFSQAQGYEEIPGPLKLKELPKEARIQIWNVFYIYLDESKYAPDFLDIDDGTRYLGSPWNNIFKKVHVVHDNQPIDEWSNNFQRAKNRLRDRIETQPFNKVFDLVQFVIRHPECPSDFIETMKRAFAFLRLAYIIDGESPTDKENPPTILPAVTQEEGNALLESLQTLRDAGLSGGAKHLRNASACINQGDWAESVKESIHAVESVASTIDPKASQTLGPALASIEKHGALHPALKSAFNKLYGYTSDEQGIRHALRDQAEADVGMDEAVFMLGACASFASYLWRKYQANTGA